MTPKKKPTQKEETLLGAFTTIEFGNSAINISLLILRIFIGGFMLKHGIQKWIHFDAIVDNFPNPVYLGSRFSLQASICIEIVCSIFILLGLLTRLFIIPVILQMFVIICLVHLNELLSEGELSIFYFVGYLVLFFLGPGKLSIDATIQHRMGNDELAGNDDEM